MPTLEQGVPGVIISPSCIAVGALEAIRQLHAEQVSVERPVAGHHLRYVEVHLSVSSLQPCVEVAY